MSCTRADGTVTRQRQDPAKAQFFVRHDLTHYALETVLGHRRGFYGLVAEGWDFTDFGSPWPRGRSGGRGPSEPVGRVSRRGIRRAGTGDGSDPVGELTAADLNAQRRPSTHSIVS